jgi:hypothetical protein
MAPELRRLAVRAVLTRLALDHRPVLVGPWRSEVGFEALYWIPFLKWCCDQVPSLRERAIIVTRGGAGCLYGVPPERAVDLYALRDVRDVAKENIYQALATKMQKQMVVTSWDRAVMNDAAAQLGLTRYHVLHPAWMYWALEPFWNEDRGLKYLASMTDYDPIPKMARPNGLPSAYVAVKFYGRATWPHPHPLTADFAAKMTGTIAAQTPVVLLNSGHAGDEHTDLVVSGPNVYALPAVKPEKNLTQQIAVLSHATAFVGTYGGTAQLALRLGIPSASFWTHFGGTAWAHHSVSGWLSQASQVPFLTGSVGDLHLWKQVLVAPKPQAQMVAA